jgi:hypothetical protein
MGWLDKLLGREEEKAEKAENGQHVSFAASSVASPFEGLDGIRFGRYSDNNKSQKKMQSRYAAEDYFKAKRYNEAFAAFFDFLRDDVEDNVRFSADGDTFSFDIIQGSKKVHGESDGKQITAKVALAVMPTPVTAVMRRLLELNFTLLYCHCAMDENNTLCMVMDSTVTSASPSKLYQALHELATKADRTDDLLLADFSTLKPADTDHIVQLSEAELTVKFSYFKKWITETLARVDGLNQDAYAGAITYLLLSLLYRIDFLITPEARLLAEVEKISTIYWLKKEEITLVERNQRIKDAIRKLLDLSLEEFKASVYRSKGSFAISAPPGPDKIKDTMMNTVRDSHGYMENKYEDIALVLLEYGMLYNQFVYSMPRVLTDLITIFMGVLHADYMTALGMKTPMYNTTDNVLNRDAITVAIDEAINRYKDRYQQLRWDHSSLNYDSLYDFAVSYAEQVANLNLETKR